MRLRIFDRLRRSFRSPPARGAGAAAWALTGDRSTAATPATGRHRRDGEPGEAAERWPAGPGQPAAEAGPFGSPVGVARPRVSRLSRAETASQGNSRRPGAAKAAIRPVPRVLPEVRPGPAARPGSAARQVGERGREQRASASRVDGLPWYEVAHARRVAEGHRDCGQLEMMLQRDWEEGTVPPPEAVRAINHLAGLPSAVKESLAGGLDAIFVGPGGVPDLDDMGRLRGVPLPSGRATWDACAGAYGDRKIIVGSRPSAAPDVMCHEVGHALDDIDGSGGLWQSDSEDFRTLYARCLPRLTSDFHRQEGALGRREFFADAFSAIASRQRPALVDMLGGDTRIALDVMVYFNVRYGI